MLGFGAVSGFPAPRLTLPGTLLKSSPPLAALEKRASDGALANQHQPLVISPWLSMAVGSEWLAMVHGQMDAMILGCSRFFMFFPDQNYPTGMQRLDILI